MMKKAGRTPTAPITADEVADLWPSVLTKTERIALAAELNSHAGTKSYRAGQKNKSGRKGFNELARYLHRRFREPNFDASDDYDALEALRVAMIGAEPIICPELPHGKPPEWKYPAHRIWHVVHRAFGDPYNERRGYNRKSVVVRVTVKVIKRLGYSGITPGALEQSLKRANPPRPSRLLGI